LGIQSSASEQEIRRAYRILARRYHPDVNPGKDSSDKFKLIAEAYQILMNAEKRKQHDLKLNADTIKAGARGHRAYADEMRRRFQEQSKNFQKSQGASTNQKDESSSRQRRAVQPGSESTHPKLWTENLKRVFTTPIPKLFSKRQPTGTQTEDRGKEVQLRSVSIIEVSVSIEEAIFGTKKTLEIPNGFKPMKISVRIPSGVTSGSTVRMRSEKLKGQELVCVVQVSEHPYLEMVKNGLIVSLPVTLAEAYHGATVEAPTLTDPVVLKVPPRSQTGLLIPLKNQGPVMKNGIKGDLLYRVIVQAPRDGAAPQYEALMKELDNAYNENVRGELPRSLGAKK
ncbi:MAG: DnaJ domain-containing protein, partial [Bdellovibrionales bacterium]|nr:DnaJ domain-containing protein [Bdellovibrionales bacterium]